MHKAWEDELAAVVMRQARTSPRGGFTCDGVVRSADKAYWPRQARRACPPPESVEGASSTTATCGWCACTPITQRALSTRLRARRARPAVDVRLQEPKGEKAGTSGKRSAG